MTDFKHRLEASSLGIEMGGCVAAGYLLGTWADGQLGTEPWGLVIFLACGFGAAVKALVRITRRERDRTRRAEPEAGQKRPGSVAPPAAPTLGIVR